MQSDFLKRINYYLVIIPVLLFSIGYVVQLSTSGQRASTQLLYFFMSCLLFYILSAVDYRLLNYLANPLYLFILVSLSLVFFIGESALGAVRWLSVGFINFQPSEFAKFVFVVFIGVKLSGKVITKPVELFKLLLSVLPIIVLVFIQPDLGSTLILVAILIGMLFMARISIWYFILGICLLGFLSTPIWYTLKEYQQHRVLVFINPSLDVAGKGYNVIQSLISVGSGGLLGKGFGRGTQSHLNFLPIFWTDFVFAAFAEEWGFLGVFLLIALYGLLFFSILKVINEASDRLGVLICSGVFFALFSQTVINIGMNMGLLPVTGIPLPLISYGGTSMLSTGMLLGLVHSVWLNGKKV